jgi:ABC-2 type transport system permease protein
MAVAGVECSKLRSQLKTRVVLGSCTIGPFAFVAAIRMQNSVPEDTLFGRAVKESGFATPLVILGFAALWIFPVLTSVVGGDLFSAEDRYRTWTTLLTRSRSRAEVFAGKVLVALGFALLAVVTLAISSIAAGVLVIGFQPLIDLSGTLLTAPQALADVACAWASVVPPALGFTAVAVLVSVASRSSAAGVGLPVVAGLLMQLYDYVDGPLWIRELLVASAFGAWHGLVTEHRFYRPLVHGTAVSAAYLIVCLAVAYRLLQRRDIAR